MALDVYYPNDIRNALLAAQQAASSAGGDDQFMQGYEAALRTIALAFGLVVQSESMMVQPRRVYILEAERGR